VVLAPGQGVICSGSNNPRLALGVRDADGPFSLEGNPTPGLSLPPPHPQRQLLLPGFRATRATGFGYPAMPCSFRGIWRDCRARAVGIEGDPGLAPISDS